MDTSETTTDQIALQANHHTELLIRRPGEKNALKEKFVAIYESFFMVPTIQCNVDFF